MDSTIWIYFKKRLQQNPMITIFPSIKKLSAMHEAFSYQIALNDLIKISPRLQIPTIEDIKELALILKTKNLPKMGECKIIFGRGHFNETLDKKYISLRPTEHLLVRASHINRYFVDTAPQGRPPRWVKNLSFLLGREKASEVIKTVPKLVARHWGQFTERRLNFALLEEIAVISDGVTYGIAPYNIHSKFLLGILNSTFLEWLFNVFSQTRNVKSYELESLPFFLNFTDQQAPIISLVDAIIQKKKEYHAISQNIENYVDFEKVDLIRLDEFLKGVLDDFEVVSSLKVKHDNFNALRLRIEGDRAILEYGMRRRVENDEEIEEDEQTEVRGRYVVEWHTAGEGRIKDRLAVEFLAKMIEKEKRFSKARSKTMWQKIAEVKVPEFTSEVRKGFSEYKSAMEKAKELDEEITRIDRAIDRLVYDLYGLTEDEVKVVEKSVWGDKFDEMYGKLPLRDSALRLAEEVKDEADKG